MLNFKKFQIIENRLSNIDSYKINRDLSKVLVSNLLDDIKTLPESTTKQKILNGVAELLAVQKNFTEDMVKSAFDFIEKDFTAIPFRKYFEIDGLSSIMIKVKSILEKYKDDVQKVLKAV